MGVRTVYLLFDGKIPSATLLISFYKCGIQKEVAIEKLEEYVKRKLNPQASIYLWATASKRI